MKPIYFPFTFIPESILKEIRMFFPKIVIYQPSSGRIPEFLRKTADDGLLEIRAPFGGDESQFDRLVREYREWLDYHKGSETTYFKSRIFDSVDLETVPMYSDNSTTQIKHDIKKGPIEKKTEKPDKNFTARLFLLIAQEFDIQQYELKTDLERFQVMENNLFSNIRGTDENFETGISKVDSTLFDDLGEQKTSQRISAWLKIFNQDPVAPDEFGSGLFLTSSPAVMEHIMELFPDIELVLSTRSIPAHELDSQKIKEIRQNLRENLTRLSRNSSDQDLLSFPEMPSANNNHTGLKIYCTSQNFPQTPLGGLSNRSDEASHTANSQKFQKTFFGIVESKRE